MAVTWLARFWPELVALCWLAPLAVYTQRHRPLPHLALVLVPCTAAVVYAIGRREP